MTSEADQAAAQYLASKGLVVTGNAITPAAPEQSAPAPTNFIQMPLQIVQQIAQGYKQYGWALKLARVKIPPQIHEALTLIADGNSQGVAELQKMAGQQGSQQQPAITEQAEQQPPDPQVGETVVTRKMAAKMYKLHESGWGTRKIADYFTQQGSPVSHATVATVINEYEAETEAETDEQGNSRISGMLRTLGTLGSFAAISAFMLLIAHFILHF